MSGPRSHALGLRGRDGGIAWVTGGARVIGLATARALNASEVAGPIGEMFRLIREASEGGDGSAPVRPFPDLLRL